MKRLKGIAIFGIIFTIILFLDYILYKNLDKFMPTYENRVYSFENNSHVEEKEFLFEMYEQVEMQNKRYKDIDEEELNNINKNEIIYNILRKEIFKDVEENKFKQIVMENFYTDKLSNTVYGNLKVIGNLYDKPYIIILYSEDMSKVYYINLDEVGRFNI